MQPKAYRKIWAEVIVEFVFTGATYPVVVAAHDGRTTGTSTGLRKNIFKQKDMTINLYI